MPTYDRQTMCSECPFRATSIKGWLGPWTPEEIEREVRADNDFICHQEIEHLTPRGLSDAEIVKQGQHCVGFLRYMSRCLKMSRDPLKAAAQAELKKTPDDAVLAPGKFVEHHQLEK